MGSIINSHNYNTSVFTQDEVDSINKLLVSQFKPVNEDRYTRKQKKYNKKEKGWKFDFDSTDTLPYWYSNLGRCFNLSEYDVADIADKYIHERLGYSGKIQDDEHVKEDWQLTSNNHGGLPTVENLKRYYEYHGMFCAASQLLEKEPLIETEPDSWQSWEHWIESKSLAWKNFWLSDLRDPVPLNKKFWINENITFDENWRDNIEQIYYDNVIGLTNNLEKDSLFVYGDFTRYFGENYESVSLRSAIVTPSTSESLLRALQTTENTHDYRIPLENDVLQINESKFKLLGWLKEERSENEGLDQNDPFSNGESRSYVRLGKEVEEIFQINYRDNPKHAYYKNEKVFENQNWSNEKERKSYSTFESSGSIAFVNINFLLDFLKKREINLILECTISRQLKERNYNFSSAKRKNETKLYLIKSNGDVKSVRGRSYKIGQKDC